MELFNNMDLRQYRENGEVQKEIIKYISNQQITSKDLLGLAPCFPTKATKNIVEWYIK